MNATAVTNAAQALPSNVAGVDVRSLLDSLGSVTLDFTRDDLYVRCLGAYAVLSAVYGHGTLRGAA